MLNTHHLSDLIDTITAGINHFLTSDITIFSVNDKLTVGFAAYVFHRIKTIHVGASLTCMPRQCSGNARWIDITIEWIPPGTQHSVCVQ